jgi:hypothetical protein
MAKDYVITYNNLLRGRTANGKAQSTWARRLDGGNVLTPRVD